MWSLYICDRNGQLYTGITTDLNMGSYMKYEVKIQFSLFLRSCF